MYKRCVAVLGLGYGDEGKGSVVDALTRRLKPRAVLRFNGGPQAAHHVISPDARLTHCFSQFGAGSLLPGVETWLTPGMRVEPLALLREAETLAAKGIPEPLARMNIDSRCLLVTPFHRALSRMREIVRGVERRGSCGLGVGEALRDSLRPGFPSPRIGDIYSPRHLRALLKLLWRMKLDRAEQLLNEHPQNHQLQSILNALARPKQVERLSQRYDEILLHGPLKIRSPQELNALLAGRERLIFEGAQGALLDQRRGFWPYVTSSDTSFTGVEALLSPLGLEDELSRIGVLRSYQSRHGPGPFLTEDPLLSLPEAHNHDNPWQGPFRTGWFDAVATRYALRILGGVDGLALNHLDQLKALPREAKGCVAYKSLRTAPLLDMEGGEVLNLKLPRDRREQFQLQESLSLCQPRYERFVSREPQFLEWLQEQLPQVPLLILSRGPKADQKFHLEPGRFFGLEHKISELLKPPRIT